jgi:hypothetical protein
MSSKNFTFLVILISLVPILIGVDQLSSSRNKENVIQATDAYILSGHADKESLSFTNWDAADPPQVPANCAKCHSTTGFLDFLGEDGSTIGVTDQEVPTGEVIVCHTCHNPSAHRLSKVDFHSGAMVETETTEAVCLTCHQSRQSTNGIEQTLQGYAEEEVAPNLSFINPHYNFAASTQFGSAAHSGYEYPNLAYAGYFFHAANASACTECHNAHSLQVDPQQCATCHVNVVTQQDFLDIRMQKTDYDGNGDIEEGIYFEINTLSSYLLEALQNYAHNVAGTPIVYENQFPYFFIDSDQDGFADPDEVNFPNRYNTWTPRLLKAAYNYQFYKKDIGGYIHNPRYIIQLLHDSLVNIGSPSDLANIDLPRP